MLRLLSLAGALIVALLVIPALLDLPEGSVRSLWLERAAAQSAPPPVEVVVEGVFGPDALVEGGYTGLVVTLTNRSATAYSGSLEISVSEWNSPPERHVIAVDLPGSESRRVQATVFIPTSGSSIDARYYDDAERLLGLGSQSVAYAAGATSIVVIAEQPARLRAALLDLQIDEPAGSTGYPAYGSTRTVTLPVGGSMLDGRTGDPILPRDPHAYSTARLVIASAPTLARIGEPELRALEDYVLAGGELVIAPRSPADHALPVVRRFFGEVTRWDRAFAGYAPPETPLYHCSGPPEGGGTMLEDGAGCARPYGHGVLRLLPWDLTTPPSAGEAGVEIISRSLVLQLIAERDGRASAALPLGTGLDSTDASYWDGTTSFAYLRRALDPNEGYRTSLALVAVLLFFYVLVVGPIHFKVIERRNQPTLALVTTPLLAMACAAVLFAVGYLGKGIEMRYRRIGIVELAAGSERACARSYTGYFFTRPASATLSTTPGTIPRRIAAPGGIAGPRYLHREDRVEAESMRGGLWDTIFVREDRMLDVPGGLDFELRDGRIVAVINESELVIQSAILVDHLGAAYVVGDIPAHGRVPVPDTTGWYLYEGGGSWYGEGGDATTTALSALLRLSADEAPLSRGIQALLGDQLIESAAPVLYGWIAPDDPPATEPGFSREWDRRLLRVTAAPAMRDLAVPLILPAPGTIGLSGDAARLEAAQ